MRHVIFTLSILLGLAQAQYENRLLAGGLENTAIYPGGGSVAFGRADFIAGALGLGYLEVPGEIYLSTGSKVASFRLTNDGGDAARYLNGYRNSGAFWVPVRELAKNLDLYYRNDYGAPVLALKPAKLLEVQRVAKGLLERYILKFDRDVQAKIISDNPTKLALAGLKEAPEIPADSQITLTQTDWGGELTLPKGDGPAHLLFLPQQIIVERGGGGYLPRVVLDAGHGGVDLGVTVDTLREKDLTQSVVNKLAAQLKGKTLETALTRSADKTVPLLARAQYAANGQVFISVHAAAGNKITVYTYPEVQTLRLLERGRELSARTPKEQKAILDRYVAPPGSAARFAQSIVEAFAAEGIVASTSEDALYVLSMAGGAAALVEVGIEQLRTPQARDQVASVLNKAIVSYLGLPSAPPATNPTATPKPSGGNKP